ncbi:MAG TPA: sugar transferase [Gemmatimonadales bacterium]|nr:sugar transferase [Gemmatimonadales bacterium]
MDRYWRRLRVDVIVGDVLAVLAAYTLAAGARFGFGHVQFGGVLWPVYPILALAVAAFTVFLAWQYGTYRRWALLGGHRVYPLLATVATYGVLSVMVLSYILGGSPLVSRGWLLAAWLNSIVCLSVGRLLWRQVALQWRRDGLLVRKVLIAGANRQGVAVAQQLHNPTLHGTMVLGFLDDYQRPGTEIVPGVSVVGHPASVLEQAQLLGADEVIIIAGALAWESQRLLAEMVTRPDAPIDARISPTFYDLLTTSAELSHVAYVPMLSLTHTRLSGLNSLAKTAVDQACAATLLLLFLPFWAYSWARARARHVPMFEKQEVLGVGGKPFNMVALNPLLTASPLLVRLPAMWNVLMQQLSLVGPRPIASTEVKAHEPWLPNLFTMRPGLSGMWRLRAREFAIDDRVALDLYYIRNYTLALDIQVLWHTARALLLRSLRRDDGLARWQEARPVVAGMVEVAPRPTDGAPVPSTSSTSSAPTSSTSIPSRS